ncbi:hypothetical protein EV356DRAFT_509347 [Viridothelium virens]|uniref:Uncharacterized protein n=1 Tax=Viridothelium virens TaxID=1048519 RepID=A0A6A6GX50_VIRVR|nr:hypothetical protein EV356DRAFT_509347 [Viridothelium virens]
MTRGAPFISQAPQRQHKLLRRKWPLAIQMFLLRYGSGVTVRGAIDFALLLHLIEHLLRLQQQLSTQQLGLRIDSPLF